jgi:RNAse (barnase) inhibitor barstar
VSALADLLRPGSPSFHLTDASQAVLGRTTVELSIERRTVAARRIRGSRCRTTKGLFDEMAAALQFPAYFGGNWNALDDMLSDLGWLPAEAYLLVVEDADEMLVEEADEVLAVCLDVLATSAASASPVPFQFVLQSARDGRVARALTVNGTTYDTVAI